MNRWQIAAKLAAIVVLLLVVFGAGNVSRKAPTRIIVPGSKYEARLDDPRLEAVARAICIARGINPDWEGLPYPPGPVWEYFVPDAAVFLAQFDAAKGKP